MKIFKYDYDPSTLSAFMPEDAVILRIDHVDDGFYKGTFLWAIVDEMEACVQRTIGLPVGYSACAEPDDIASLEKIQLGVQESQCVTSGIPRFAKEDSGKIFIYSQNSDAKEHTIAVYKTGQSIPIPIDRLSYLGLNRLWIIQELGLYTFRVKP